MAATIQRSADRGCEFREQFELLLDGAALTDIVVEAVVCTAPGEAVLLEPTITVSTVTAGVASCELVIADTESAALPDHVIIDIRSSVASEEVGKTLVLRIELTLHDTAFPA